MCARARASLDYKKIIEERCSGRTWFANQSNRARWPRVNFCTRHGRAVPRGQEVLGGAGPAKRLWSPPRAGEASSSFASGCPREAAAAATAERACSQRVLHPPHQMGHSGSARVQARHMSSAMTHRPCHRRQSRRLPSGCLRHLRRRRRACCLATTTRLRRRRTRQRVPPPSRSARARRPSLSLEGRGAYRA